VSTSSWSVSVQNSLWYEVGMRIQHECFMHHADVCAGVR
jgi:hypothetical protein